MPTRFVNISRLVMAMIGIAAVSTVLHSAEPRASDKKRIVYRMFTEYSKEFPTVKTIAPKKVLRIHESEDVVVVDVRHEEEMAVSVIPGAITKSGFLSRKESYYDKIIVVYCTIGYRSGIFAAEMQQQGFDVYNLKGGILSWVLEGGNVRNDTGIVNKIHVYGEKWRYVPEGYDAVVFGFFEGMLK